MTPPTARARGPAGALSASVETLERLLASRRELLETLGKRQQRLAQAKDNLALVLSEQERLDQQIKLIRAELDRNEKCVRTQCTELTLRLNISKQPTIRLSQIGDQFRDLIDRPAARSCRHRFW